MSSDFLWDLERPERTVEGLAIYDVRRAKQIIVALPRPVELLDMVVVGSQIEEYLEDVKLKDNVDWNAVDTTLPVIFVRTPEGKCPIDGRHRLAKTVQEKLPSIPVVYLTVEESKAVRVG